MKLSMKWAEHVTRVVQSNACCLSGEKLDERDSLVDLTLDGIIQLEGSSINGSLDWVRLAQNRNQGWAFLNSVMKLAFREIRKLLDQLNNYQLLKVSFSCSS